MKCATRLAAVLLGHLAVTSSATVHYVNLSSTNTVPPFTDWSIAATNIQDAVDVAVDGDLVLVMDGVFQTGSRTVDGTTPNRLAVTNALTIQSVNGSANTTIDGGSVARCVYLADGATLVGFTLTNGFSPSNGGGVFGSTTNSVVSNCVVTSCSAPNGGGLWGGSAINSILTSCGQSGSTTGGGGSGCRLTNCRLQNNAATSGGGAIASTLIGCEVINNSASIAAGGLQDCSASYCEISGNTAGSSGGGAVGGSLTSCRIVGNQVAAPSGSAVGGGVAGATANDCVIEGNSAPGYGGGAYGSTLYNCIIYNNGAVWGGGTWVCVLAGCWLSHNFAFIDGGADVRSGMLDCTIVQNYSGYGGVGGVDGGNLYNCIVYFNLAADATGGIDVPSNGANTSYSDCCTTPMPSSGSGNITNPPSFQPDGIHLTASSSCRGAGNLAYTRGVDINGLAWLDPPSIGCAEYSTNAAPSLALQANYTNVLVGQPLAFQASVTGDQATYVSWSFGDLSSDGSGLATSHAWTSPGDYSVLATAFFANTPLNATASLVIHVFTNVAPVIEQQPTNQTVVVGFSAAFSVLATNFPLLAYQWQFNGTNIPGATNSALQVNNARPDQAGNYSVLITNLAALPSGWVLSSNALLTVTPTVCVPPPSMLFAWWRGESNAEDHVGGNNGILTNGAGFAPGQVGQAFSFDGSGGYVLVPSTLALEPSGPFTLEAWIKCNDVSSTNGATLVMKGLDDGGPPEWALSLTPAGRLDFGITYYEWGFGLTGGGIVCSTVLQTGRWYHVAVVVDSLYPYYLVSAFLDGVLDGGNYLPGYTYPTQDPIKIGASVSAGTFFSGQIDELSFYGRALTQAELQGIYQASIAGKCDLPVPPFILLQPVSTAVLPRTNASFSVAAAGSIPFTYQWYVNDSPIPGETNSTVTVANVQYAQSGSLYSARVTNAGGSILSSNAVLTVINTPPLIPGIAAQHVLINSSTGPIPFMVSDAEDPADLLVVSGSSSNTNLVPNPQIMFAGSGTNRFVTLTPASNAFGSVTISLTVTDLGGLTAQMNFTLFVDLFEQLALGLPPLQRGAVAWGDYDNDGALDLLISGSTNGAPSGGLTRLYHNDGGQFTNFISLPGLYGSAIAWGDYDRDGRLDFVVSGMTASNIPITRIYHNNGDGTFTDINAGLLGVYFGSVAWGDYDNDGAPDLIVSGTVPINPYTDTNVCRLYHNEGNGRFLDTHASLPAPTDGTTAWGDFDNDGRLDLLLVGNLGPRFQSIAAIYRNLGSGVFTNCNAGLQPSSSSQLSAAWGDYDDDGLLDVAMASGSALARIYHNTGSNTVTLAASLANPNFPSVLWGDFDNDGLLDLLVSDYTSHLYRNNGNGAFSDTRLSLPANGSESAAWADVYNSGALDIVFAGNASPSVLRNHNVIRNTPPAAPSSLTATVAPTNTVVFTWSPAFDAQTPSNGLSYNLRVGTTPGGFDVVSPQADPLSGQRRLPAMGSARPTNRAFLNNLPAGTYYWSVQAIDIAFAGSPFASEATFTITNSRPVISPIADQTIAPATPTPLIPFVIGDIETVASNLLVSVQSSDTNVVPLAAIIISGTDSDRTVQITPRTNGVSLITIHVTDEQGAFGTASFLLTSTQFVPASTNFLPVQNSIIAWGDFNNDGRLDVLVAGNTNGNPAASPVTQLYRNDGNGVFTPIPTSLPGVTYGSAAWGDFNNDGRLDLVLTGTTNGQPSGAFTRIYRNDNGSLTDIGAALPALFYSSAAWGDFDNDGRLDLLLAGLTNSASSSAITQVYRNNGDGTFSLLTSLTGIFQGTVACGDLDGDGALDIILTGRGQSGTVLSWVFRNNKDGTFTPTTPLPAANGGCLAIGDFDGDGHPDIFMTGGSLTRLYQNIGNFAFTNLGVNLPAVANASAAWGDFNNDGRLDLVLSGTVNGGPSGALTRLYLNTGSLIGSLAFSNFPANLPANYLGTVTWADFNQDNKLDLLVAGTDGGLQGQYRSSQAALFSNTSGIPNTPPSAPGGLAFVRSNATVLLSWAPSTDAQTTNSAGLTYDLRVGRNSGAIDVVSPPADIGTGLRRLVQTGTASTTQWRLINLPPGTYHWSAQAIDTSFAGSPFAPEATFVVLTPPITVPDAVFVSTNTSLTIPASELTLNDIETNGYPLTVTAVSPGSVRGGVVMLNADIITYTPPLNFSGNDWFTYTISDGQSASALGTVFVTVGSGGPIALRIAFGPVVVNGDFVIRYSGVPGLTYTIEATSDLNGPWAKVGNITAPAVDVGFGPGIFEASAPISGQGIRFYRVAFPAY